MRPLDIEALARRASDQPLLIFADFDGTLAHHRPDGDRSLIAPETRAALAALRTRRGAKVAVVSGRPVRELKARVGVKRLLYAGNHGLELDGDGERFAHPMSVPIAATVGAAVALLRRRLREHPRAVVDDNGLSLSVNYGLVPPARRAAVQRVIGGSREELAWLRLRLEEGHLGWDITPEVSWDKGSIVAMLAGKWPDALAIAVGDGLADEAMFRAISPKGVAIRVGRARLSLARHWVSGPAEIGRLFARLAR